MTRRVFVVGTDTGVGKTAVTCSLLRRAHAMGVRAVPFKPAASGEPDANSDPARLARATTPPISDLTAICPHRYAEPLAPGVAADPALFVSPDVVSPDSGPLHLAAAAQRHLIRATHADLILIEGAGGLHVPMPGGTWQGRWIAALADHCIVVARAGLGTINHTLLTIDALRAIDRDPLGFVLCTVSDSPDDSRETNAAVIERARAVPCLGISRYRRDPDTDAGGWLAAEAVHRVFGSA